MGHTMAIIVMVITMASRAACAVWIICMVTLTTGTVTTDMKKPSVIAEGWTTTMTANSTILVEEIITWLLMPILMP